MKKKHRKIRRRVTRRRAVKQPSRRTRQHAKHASRKIKKHKKMVRKHKKTIKKHKKIRRHAKHRTRRHKSSKPKTYIGKGILDQLFESQAKVKLMKFFFRNANEVFPIRDILKTLRVGSFSVRREMKKLEKTGVIRKTKRQGKVVYLLNEDFDFFKELKDLMLKSTISSKQELINSVRKIGNIKLLVLSGVFGGKESGADLLLVGDKINQRKFSTFLKDLEAEVGKELNCALMTSKEFNYRYDMYDRFVRDLISEDSDVLINKLNLW